MNDKRKAMKVFAYIGVTFLLIGFVLVGIGFYGIIMKELSVGSAYFTILITGTPFFIIGVVYSLIGLISLIDKSRVEQLRCPYCGFRNPVGTKRCSRCNQKLK